MLVYRCEQKGCKKIAEKGSRYCAKHQLEHNRKAFSNRTRAEKLASYKKYNETKRDKEADMFYHSQSWTQVRNYVANRDMYISGVSGRVISDHNLIVDHIIPRRLVSDKLDTKNLWCLSRKEHLIKTKIEESLTDNQLSHVSRQWWIKLIKERLN